MNAIVMEFLKVVLPPLCTGIITFLITRYECNKDVPLDKMEITYNKVYFPMYRLIADGKSLDEIKEKSEKYMRENFKYVNETTWKAFKYLSEANRKEEQKALLIWVVVDRMRGLGKGKKRHK